MIVVLVGYMGSGKSTIGQALARELGLPFVDMDSYIENRLEQPVSEVFRTRGELYFRRTEHKLLGELLAEGEPMVLALGGGTPCYAGNMDLVLENTPNVVYLQLSVGALARRLEHEKSHRPLIAHLTDEELPEFIGKHLFERSPFYSKAPITIIGEQPAGAVVEEIKRLLV